MAKVSPPRTENKCNWLTSGTLINSAKLLTFALLTG